MKYINPQTQELPVNPKVINMYENDHKFAQRDL